MRTFDSDLVAKEVLHWKGPLEGFDPVQWLQDQKNIALLRAEDLALFQYELPGIYIGHYFFNSRGKGALVSGSRLLAEIFSYKEVEAVKGYTPLTNLGARWISRQLGFKSGGVIKLEDEYIELFILTKKEYMNG